MKYKVPSTVPTGGSAPKPPRPFRTTALRAAIGC
jgi:hypothetical protein